MSDQAPPSFVERMIDAAKGLTALEKIEVWLWGLALVALWFAVERRDTVVPMLATSREAQFAIGSLFSLCLVARFASWGSKRIVSGMRVLERRCEDCEALTQRLREECAAETRRLFDQLSVAQRELAALRTALFGDPGEPTDSDWQSLTRK